MNKQEINYELIKLKAKCFEKAFFTYYKILGKKYYNANEYENTENIYTTHYYSNRIAIKIKTNSIKIVFNFTVNESQLYLYCPNPNYDVEDDIMFFFNSFKELKKEIKKEPILNFLIRRGA